MKSTRRFVAGLVLAIFTLALAPQAALAANWFQLQGTQPAKNTKEINVWGFVQPTYYQNDSEVDESASHQQDEFNLRRARLGVRGIIPKTDGKINYFLLSEWGRNGITEDPKGDSSSLAALTDASITLNHIKGMRIRAGQFKAPVGLDGLQAIHVHNYIEFSDVYDQLVMERFGLDRSVSAFRDIGVQAFDWMYFGADKKYELAYALMVGNGNGINSQDNDDNRDITGKITFARIFDKSKGPRRQEVQVGLWYQKGKRTGHVVAKDADGVVINGEEMEQDRKRYGIDFIFNKKLGTAGALRVAAESVWGEGWVLAPDGFLKGAVPKGNKFFTDNTSVAGHGIPHADLKAHGWYVDLGYRPPVLKNKLELDVRYSAYDPDHGNDLDVDVAQDTLTLGAQYFLHPRTKIMVNHEIKDSDWNDAVDNRTMAQLTLIFK